MEIVGAPSTVIAGGNIAYNNGQFCGKAGSGKYVNRACFGMPVCNVRMFVPNDVSFPVLLPVMREASPLESIVQQLTNSFSSLQTQHQLRDKLTFIHNSSLCL